MSDAPIRCVLFDLDGTLVDTAPDLGRAANHVRATLGLAPLPLADYRVVASAGARGLLGKALGITPEHADFDVHRRVFLDHYRAHLADASRPFAGVNDLLTAIEAAGRSWGVMTNKPAWLTAPLLEALGLAARARCVVSADEVPRAKPAPDGLLRAAALAGVATSDCIYVGDDLRDIDAARAAGMFSVAAAWGYIGEAPLERWGADLVAATPGELQRWLAERPCSEGQGRYTTRP
ncbi:HAD family hydrolase [Sinimarinibacterium thermocellulolyticum]|uniref:HAD-IA family hydrolase n=1 Tax=Sinimarinibacterium thermocellulolyticum TaxID=3170016 RepID=A0ABV2A814_9GAMM